MISVPSVLVIAEAGVNHNGSLERALALVDEAAAAGADVIKFQTFQAAELAAAYAEKAIYQQHTTGAGSQLDMLRALQLSPADHHALRLHCDRRGIEFLSAPFDLPSVDFLASLGLRRIKIPSGELTDVPLLRRVARLGLPIILSSGMATLAEVRAAVDIISRAGCDRDSVTVLHCTTEYPTPVADVNLRAMLTLRAELGVAVGYSDHTEGIVIPVAAAALGATVIEKHLTISRDLPGPDHRASLEPPEFATMVRALRDVQQALGDGEKRPTRDERANAAAARKSIVAGRAIAAGERLDESNLAVRRPGTGISALLWDEVAGLVATRAYERDEQIDEDLR